jgi:hypothetical protein
MIALPRLIAGKAVTRATRICSAKEFSAYSVRFVSSVLKQFQTKRSPQRTLRAQSGTET